ncbi:MAG: 4-hydroxybenzoate octaprenyltransferase [Phycisphaerae bacterium]|nr:MAG: 4-hydroxybenzoate octaprenyltransferase [Phycisphaerae bacterium]
MTSNEEQTATVTVAPSAVTAKPEGGERARVGASLLAIAADIKIAHSVFALPFAVFGAFLAGPASMENPEGKAWWVFAGQVGLVVGCMVLARTWAMLINRLVDRKIDAEHERTKGRAFASGRASTLLGWSLAAACAAGFVGLTWFFHRLYANPWPLYLALPVLALLAFYSWTKRFTWLCHAVLGLALAISPIAAALAVRPAALLGTPTLWWTSAFVLLWVAGFDIIYALQDEAFDRTKGLRSIPAKLGAAGAVWAARMAHGMALVALLAAWTSHAALGVLFGAGMALAAGLLAVEHTLLARSARGANATPRLHMMFFTLNGVVSLALGVAGCVDLVM